MANIVSVILLLTVALAYFPRYESAIKSELDKTQADPKDVPTEDFNNYRYDNGVSSYRTEFGKLHYYNTEKERLLVESENRCEIKKKSYNNQYSADNNEYVSVLSNLNGSMSNEKQLVPQRPIGRAFTKAPPVKRSPENPPSTPVSPIVLKNLAGLEPSQFQASPPPIPPRTHPPPPPPIHAPPPIHPPPHPPIHPPPPPPIHPPPPRPTPTTPPPTRRPPPPPPPPPPTRRPPPPTRLPITRSPSK